MLLSSLSLKAVTRSHLPVGVGRLHSAADDDLAAI
jgi:hypothetical protein